MEAIVFPDVEQLLIDHLLTKLTVPVSTAIPNPRPDSFVTVTRHGGHLQTLVTDAAQIGVECWASRESQAVSLAQIVRARFHALRGVQLAGVPVYRVDEYAGPANLPDSLSNQSRYVQTFAVHVRGVAL